MSDTITDRATLPGERTVPASANKQNPATRSLAWESFFAEAKRLAELARERKAQRSRP